MKRYTKGEGLALLKDFDLQECLLTDDPLGLKYAGSHAVTDSGHTCLDWNSEEVANHSVNPSVYPDLQGAGSSCRNPTASAKGLWCYNGTSAQQAAGEVVTDTCRVETCVVKASTKRFLRQKTCFARLNKEFMRREAGANVCQPPCVERNYRSIVYKQKWPTEAKFAKSTLNEYLHGTINLAKSMNKSVKNLEKLHPTIFDYPSTYIANNVAAVRIYARSVDGMSLREDWAYNLSNLFSDFGGILGLWIGVSAITVCETIELLVRLTHSKVRSSVGGEDDEKEDKCPPMRSSFDTLDSNNGQYSQREDYTSNAETQYTKYDYTEKF